MLRYKELYFNMLGNYFKCDFLLQKIGEYVCYMFQLVLGIKYLNKKLIVKKK